VPIRSNGFDGTKVSATPKCNTDALPVTSPSSSTVDDLGCAGATRRAAPDPEVAVHVLVEETHHPVQGNIFVGQPALHDGASSFGAFDPALGEGIDWFLWWCDARRRRSRMPSGRRRVWLLQLDTARTLTKDSRNDCRQPAGARRRTSRQDLSETGLAERARTIGGSTPRSIGQIARQRSVERSFGRLRSQLSNNPVKRA